MSSIFTLCLKSALSGTPYQKRLAGLVPGRRGRYHADPLLAEFGMLKIGDLNRQQLRGPVWSPSSPSCALARPSQALKGPVKAASPVTVLSALLLAPPTSSESLLEPFQALPSSLLRFSGHHPFPALNSYYAVFVLSKDLIS